MKLDLIATGGGRYRVLRNGQEVSAHTQQHTAHARGIAEKLATPDDLIEIVTDFRVRVEIAGACVADPAPAPDPEPEPSDPVEPAPVDPVPTTPVEPPRGSLFDVGATLQPGEFRVLPDATVPFNAGNAHAFGWTPRWCYDPASLSFWALGMRESTPKVLVWFDADMQWHKRRVPVDDAFRDRRPFSRLTLADIGDGAGPCLYWPSSASHPSYGLAGNRAIGSLWRAPISRYLSGEMGDWSPESDGAEDYAAWGWEQFSPPLDIHNMNTTGDFTVEYYPEMGGWIFQGRRSSSPADADVVTQEGHIEGYEHHRWYSVMMYWMPGMERWVEFDRIYGGQYQGELRYNPIKRTLLHYGGTEFGAQPEGHFPGREWTRVEEGPIARKLGRIIIDGAEADFDPSTRYCSMGYCPVTGDWLLFRRNAHDGLWSSKIWRSTDGKHWHTYRDFARDLTELFGPSYVAMTPIPGTDLVLFISQTQRVTLHRMAP